MHHLKEVEGMSLRTVEYCVFDEADRLFEMGFAAQLKEILAKMNDSRQVHTPWSCCREEGGGGEEGRPLEVLGNSWAQEQQSQSATPAVSAAHHLCSCCLQLHELYRKQARVAHSTAILPAWISVNCMHGTVIVWLQQHAIRGH